MRPQAVGVVHPHALVAEGLASALASIPGVVSAGFGTSLEDAERLAERAEALALAAGLRGVESATRKIRARGVRVIILGGEGLGDGNRVPLAAPVATLATALVPNLQDRPLKPSPLTKREEEILNLVAKGLAGKQVARQLGISAKTVEQHKAHIYSKLGVANQTAAVSVLLREAIGNGDRWIPSSI